MSEPRTEAGRYFLELLPGFQINHVSDRKLVLLHILAIEREATAPQPLDVERLAPRTEAGRRLVEGDREARFTPDEVEHLVLLIEDEAAAPQPLDVERLARALFMGDPRWHGEWSELLNEDMEIFRDRARAHAERLLARLSRKEPSDE